MPRWDYLQMLFEMVPSCSSLGCRNWAGNAFGIITVFVHFRQRGSMRNIRKCNGAGDAGFFEFARQDGSSGKQITHNALTATHQPTTPPCHASSASPRRLARTIRDAYYGILCARRAGLTIPWLWRPATWWHCCGLNAPHPPPRTHPAPARPAGAQCRRETRRHHQAPLRGGLEEAPAPTVGSVRAAYPVQGLT